MTDKELCYELCSAFDNIAEGATLSMIKKHYKYSRSQLVDLVKCEYDEHTDDFPTDPDDSEFPEWLYEEGHMLRPEPPAPVCILCNETLEQPTLGTWCAACDVTLSEVMLRDEV